MNRSFAHQPRPPACDIQRAGSSRRGLTLVECIVTAVLLGTVATLTVQQTGRLGRQQRLLQQRELALLEAGNLLERLTAQPALLPATGPVAGLRLSPETAPLLPDSQVTATVQLVTLPAGVRGMAEERPDGPIAAPVPLRRIVLQIDWQLPGQRRARPVQLVAWTGAGT